MLQANFSFINHQKIEEFDMMRDEIPKSTWNNTYLFIISTKNSLYFEASKEFLFQSAVDDENWIEFVKKETFHAKVLQ